METSIIVAGFGGQGVLFAGQLLAYAGMEDGRNVTWIPSYGPEMRGGTAHCTVIISHKAIGAPIVAQPDMAIVLNQPSYDKYVDLIKPDGILVVNSSIVETNHLRADIETVFVLANDLAELYGTEKMLNMAAIGALLGHSLFLPITAVEEALKNHLPASKQHLLEANFNVLHAGFRTAVPT